MSIRVRVEEVTVRPAADGKFYNSTLQAVDDRARMLEAGDRLAAAASRVEDPDRMPSADDWSALRLAVAKWRELVE